jgi:hypothetical protein
MTGDMKTYAFNASARACHPRRFGFVAPVDTAMVASVAL